MAKRATRPTTPTKTPAITPPLSEKAFQAQIVMLARLTGWLCYHTQNSQRSEPGWPDLALCRPGRLLLLEVKTERGRVRPEQRAWLAALAQCPGVEVALVRPSDWDAVEAALVRGERISGGF